MAAVCLLGAERGVQFIVEQPVSSVMFNYTPWDVLLQRLRPWIRHVTLHLGAFGAATLKPTHLVGTCAWLPDLKRDLVQGDRVRIEEEGVKTVLKSGSSVSGSKDLKGTQTYPVMFGAAVALAFAKAASTAETEEVALATKTEQAMQKLPPSERPVLEHGPPSAAQGDQELRIASNDWWPNDALDGKAEFGDARLVQGHALAMEA